MKRIRRTVNSLLSIVTLSTLAASGLFLACEGKKGDIKVGAVLELTGEIAAYGNAAMRGMQVAADELNRSSYFGGRRLQLSFEDSGGEPQKAVAGIQKLISTSKVPVVIGGVSSGTTLAMAPIAERSRVVLFSPGASSPALTDAGDYIFRNYPSDLFETKIMAQYLISKAVMKMSIIYSNNEFGQGLSTAFKAEFVSLGGRIVTEEGYGADVSDFRTLISKIPRSGVDGLYLPGYYQSVGLLLRQLRELGVRVPVYSCTGIEDPKFFDASGNAGEGVIYPTPSIDFDNPPPEAKGFMAEYVKRFGEQPNYPALLAYDALKIVALAMKDGGYTADSIKSALYRIDDFPGITGRTTIDSNGDAVKPFWLKVVHNGRFEMLQAFGPPQDTSIKMK
jgi:branched-chain amino acid transport system substrate-binding protein